VPTYFFIVSIPGDDGCRRFRYLTGALHECRRPASDCRPGTTMLPAFVLLTAFSNGCTALTGVEAVSNGVPAFKPPESRNARRP
jgi:hypothetical protein